MVRAFAHCAMGRRINPSWAGERCSSMVRAFAHGAMGRRIDPRMPSSLQLCTGYVYTQFYEERDVALW